MKTLIEDFDVVSYIDDNTSYKSVKNMKVVVKSLHEAFKWFFDNLMKSATDKCHLLGSTHNTVNTRKENLDIKNIHCAKLLRIIVGYKLTFNSRISDY